MPERHSSGSSESRRSSSSSSYHSTSSSRSSSYSRRSYQNDGPSSPEDQVIGWIALGVMVAILVLVFLSNQINDAHERSQNANATSTTLAITLKDMAQMHAALDPRIPEWRTVTDRAIHHMSASDAGFGKEDNTKEVVYGYCADQKFYVYVLESSTPGGYLADTEGYAYVPDSYSARDCHPGGWTVYSEDRAESDWYFVTISTTQATRAAGWTATPNATQTSASAF